MPVLHISNHSGYAKHTLLIMSWVRFLTAMQTFVLLKMFFSCADSKLYMMNSQVQAIITEF